MSLTTLKCQSRALHRNESSLMKRNGRVSYGFVNIWDLVYPVAHTTHIVLCTWFSSLLVVVCGSSLLLANIHCAICNKTRIRAVIVRRKCKHHLINLRFIHVLTVTILKKKVLTSGNRWDHLASKFMPFGSLLASSLETSLSTRWNLFETSSKKSNFCIIVSQPGFRRTSSDLREILCE